jgi:hypothetical protein
MKQKVYTKFSFFKLSIVGLFLGIAALVILENERFPGVLLPGLALMMLFFMVLSYRILQLIYRLQLDRVHDTNQVESIQWIYQQFEPKVAIPPMRVFAGSPDFIKVLLDKIQSEEPEVVLELGSGVSSIMISEYLFETGRSNVEHFALDHLEKYSSATSKKIRNPKSKILFAPLKEYIIDGKKWLWYDLDSLNQQLGEKKIDILIVDGPPMELQKLSRYPAFPLLSDKLSKEAIIILDDTIRKDEQKIIASWQNKFSVVQNEHVFTEKGTTILKTR